MQNPSLQLQIQTLPDGPGVYQYYDKEGKILYVGKAKNLKKRVASYFNKIHDTAKTNVLVKKIVSIKHIVVPTETDALLLENNLIKTLQPRYNVLLRDDKTYPWICIKKEPFSRIFPTRKMVKDGSEYFGPYTSFKTVNTILELIKELYPLRTCNYDLSKNNIETHKFKVCLEYHIGNCKGPCEGHESLQNYQRQVGAIREILKGNFKESMKDFKRLMIELAQEMRFEEAQKIKEKIDTILALYFGTEDKRQGITSDPVVSITERIGTALYYISTRQNGITDTELTLIAQARTAIDSALKSTNSFFENEWGTFKSEMEAIDLSPFKSLKTFEIKK